MERGFQAEGEERTKTLRAKKIESLFCEYGFYEAEEGVIPPGQCGQGKHH